MYKFDLYPTKSLFIDGKGIKLYFLTEVFPIEIYIKVFHLRKEIYNQKFKIKSMKSVISLPDFPKNQSYGVACQVDNQIVNTSFETYTDWKIAPRYGFLCDFSNSDKNKKDFLETLLKLHINVVQYYDWMYRHNDLISPTSEFTDLMGRKLNQDVVREKIDICKNANIANIAYGAIYGSSLEFYNKHKDWAFYNHDKQPITFIDIFAIMNFTKNSPWRDHLLNEYKKAIRIMGFDGIHMDTYGFPKVANDHSGNSLYLDDHFKMLIDDTYDYLTNASLANSLIFNNVGSWPIEKTYDAKQSALYIEIWDPITTYEDIAALVRKVKALTKKKELIISAYLKPYFEKSFEKAINSHKYLYAILSALGAHHLIMGESKKALRTGYYCDYASLNEDEFEEIRKYYDFNSEFSEVLYDKRLNDVSLTHVFGDNIEYELLDENCSIHAFSNSIYTVIKENKQRSIINLINLTSVDNIVWNLPHKAPKKIENIRFRMLSLSKVENIKVVTPDNNITRIIEFSEKDTNRGIEIEFIVPELYLWNLIIISKRDE